MKLSQITVVMITLLHMNVAITTQDTACTKEKAYGPLSIIDEESPTTTISSFQTQILIETHPKTILAVITQRSRYTSHCYTEFGGSQSCTTKIKNVYPTKSEALEWISKGKCYVGPICPPLGNCWGSDAAKCLDENPPLTTEGRPSILYKAQPGSFVFYHTCTQDWSCNFKKTEMPIHLIFKEGRTRILTSDEFGKDIELNQTTIENGVTREGSYKVYFTTGLDAPLIVDSKANCFSNNPSNILCSFNIQEKGHNKSIIIEVDGSTFIGVLRNTLIKITGQVQSVKYGQLIRLSKPSGNSIDKPIIEDVERASNIEDVIEQINLIKAVQMQSLYNSLIIERKIKKSLVIIRKIIENLSKIDDELVGSIIGIEGKTKWINKKLFYLYPCQSNFRSWLSNCDGPLIFKHGRVYNKTDSELCFSINLEEAQQVSLIPDTKLHLDTYDMLEPESYAGDWDGWSWFTENQGKINEVIDKFGENEDGGLRISAPPLPWSLNSIFQSFLAISSFIAYVALALHFLRR